MLPQENHMKRRSFLKGAAASISIAGAYLMGLNEALGLAESISVAPLLADWTGEHGGYPRFDLVKITEFKPELLKGMDLKRGEIKSITDHKDKANFENTLAAMEDA